AQLRTLLSRVSGPPMSIFHLFFKPTAPPETSTLPYTTLFRSAQWCGHAPVLEEDIAMSNMALDLIGQARAVLAHAGAVEGSGHRSEEHTSELQSLTNLVCRLLLEKKKKQHTRSIDRSKVHRTS